MGTPLHKLFDLRGQRALVTGGSVGLGFQIAEALGESGAAVLLVSRKAADLAQASEALRARGIDATWHAADVTEPEAIAGLMEASARDFGPIDILVNNAGTGGQCPAEQQSLEDWDRVMRLNMRSVFTLSQAVGKRWMIPRQHGRIINIASIAGLAGGSPSTQYIAYASSKGAVINFTRTLAGEWGPHGINVNAIAPGLFPSRLTKNIIARHGLTALGRVAPLGRIGDDNDLKGAAVLFASAAGKHITGQILAIDGGRTAIHRY